MAYTPTYLTIWVIRWGMSGLKKTGAVYHNQFNFIPTSLFRDYSIQIPDVLLYTLYFRIQLKLYKNINTLDHFCPAGNLSNRFKYWVKKR